ASMRPSGRKIRSTDLQSNCNSVIALNASSCADVQSWDELRRSSVGIVIADRLWMPLATSGRHDPVPVLACLWELSDGTCAFVVEHRVAPRWELRMIRR